MTVTELPRAAALQQGGHGDRWIPSRAGIVNVWRYYDEILTFHDGRLLLRGPNGSGKSKALELLLPFLFDANLRPSRLSTFGTGERTMYWNMMGEGISSTTRVGYVWLEFRFLGAQERWLTCGCRLQASAHTTNVTADYFVTSLRIGAPDGISVVNEAGQPLTKAGLAEALGEGGSVYGSASDYRTAVRSALFPGLTEQRYDALITALLQLRTPKLSQRLDPALLSSLLSRALPPLGQHEIADLAEGFERLDQQRERLAELDQEVAAAKVLADRQRAYARRVLRAASAALISATTTMDNLARAAKASAEEYEGVATRKAEAERLIGDLSRELAECEAQIAGITQSEAYGRGQELDLLRQQVAEQRQAAIVIRADAARKRAQAAQDQDELRDAESGRRRRADTVSALEQQARHAAVRAGLAGVHAEIAGSASGEQARARRLLRAAVEARQEQLAAVRKAVDDHDRSVERREHAEADLEEARRSFADAREQQNAAVGRYEHALAELSAKLLQWVAGCRELRFPDPGAVVELAESETVLMALVDDVAAGVLEAITRAETLAGGLRAEQVARREDLTREIGELRADRDFPPAPPVTRTADRSVRAGAPFWRLVDFAAPTGDSVRGTIEAALEASGVLDAWVGAAGAIEGHDIFADPSALMPAPGRSLADVLIPEPDSTVPADSIRQLLESIAYGDSLPAVHPAAIGGDGTWRFGNLDGSWSKDRPAHIGALARQRAREARLRELTEEVSVADQAIAELDAELTALRARRELLCSERALRPGYADLAAANHAVTRAEAALAAADTLVRARIAAVEARGREVAEALRALTTFGAENGLPTEGRALDSLATAISQFRGQAESWLDELGELASAERLVRAVAAKAQHAVAVAEQQELSAAGAEARHGELSAKLAAVEDAVGRDYQEVLAKLDEARKRQRDRRTRLDATSAELLTLADRLGQLRSARESDAAARDKATAERDVAAQRFRHLAAGGLAADSGLEARRGLDGVLSGSEGVRAALDAARQVAAAWPSTPHEPADLGSALQRLSETVHSCRATLSASADLNLEMDADVHVFTAVVEGVRVGAAELLSRLNVDAERSRKEITDRERDLFDRTLTGDTRRHLADRIRQANELVDRMNVRLERVRTASNVAVRLVWQVAPDLPPGTKAARDLLLKDPVRLTDADRDSLHRFFRERVEQAKASNTAASWEQQLEEVFDYTSWHQFVVKVDRASGNGWQLLTRKLHGALSGGEKAIVLHLPLFAAVAAHYQAVPQAPRIILLDEVFVGVDTSNRGQVFALLSALDLDLILTSDHEWCTYAELKGIGIHQLITGSDGDDAVTTARFTWDGQSLVAAEA